MMTDRVKVKRRLERFDEFLDKKDVSGTYEGDMVDGLRDGKGTMVYEIEPYKGDKYVGEWKDDKRDGKGIYYFKNGDKYVGEWKDDKRDGKGIYYFKNGDKYEGDWKYGRRNGEGVLYFKDGSRYGGDFKDDKANGKGIYYYKNGGRYEGDFKDDKMNGKGIMYFEDGSRYEGDWKDDKKSGKGILYWPDGDRFDGEWIDDKRNGKGVFYTISGKMKFQLLIWSSDSLQYEGKELDETELKRILRRRWGDVSKITLDELFSTHYEKEMENHQLLFVYLYSKTRSSSLLFGAQKPIGLEKLLDKDETDLDERDFLEVYKHWYFLRARLTSVISEKRNNLLILEKIHLKKGVKEDKEYEKLKIEIWEEIILFNLFLAKYIDDYSWVYDDRNSLDQLVSKNRSEQMESKQLPQMKKQVLKTIGLYCSQVLLPELSRMSGSKKKSMIRKLFEENFQSGSISIKEISNLRNDFEKYVQEKLKFEQIVETLFKKLEGMFRIGLDVTLDGIEMKYFGLLFTTKSIGFGLFYEEHTTGLIYRKTVVVPAFHGRFLDEGENTFSKHGDRCREYSTNKKNLGLIFEGSFRVGKRKGKGKEYKIIKGESVEYFEGKFHNGVRHGRGEEADPESGVVKRGIWNFGNFVESSIFQFDCPIVEYREIEKHLRDSKVCGEGAYGVIYIVNSSIFSFLKKQKRKKLGKEFAVKIMKTQSIFDKQIAFRLIRRVIGMCNSLKSKHILDSFGIIKGTNKVGYVMELCEKSIEDIIIKKEEVDLPEKIRIIKETAVGMKALHAKNIMHRDLKWGNVLMAFDKTVKLTDFDTLKEDEVQWRLRTITQSSNIGTPGFRPPEVYLLNKYTLKCDVYAFGLMIYALLFEKNFPYSTQLSQC